MPIAFFEHQQTPDATIAILEGTDVFVPDMEIKDFIEPDILLSPIFFEQLIDNCGDLCRRRSLAKGGCSSRFAISGDNRRVTLETAALAEQGDLQLLDESLRQRLRCVGGNHIHAEGVIASLNDVIVLDGLVVGEDAFSLVQHVNLIAGEPIASHMSVSVDHVDLQVFTGASVRSAVALHDKHFEKLRGSLFLSGGLGCVLVYVSSFNILISTWDAFLHAIDADHLFRNSPFFCYFF